MTQKKYPLCLVCQKTYTERKGLRFRHFDDAGLFWHNAKPVFAVKLMKSKKLPSALVSLKKLVETVAKDWPAAIGDVNMCDVAVLGWRIAAKESLTLPHQLWPKDFGVQVVETIDRELIKMSDIRKRTPKDLARGSARIVEWFRSANGPDWDGPTILATSFFTWQGCISMAKSTRPSYNAHPKPLPYTQDLRWCGYYRVQHEWKEALQFRNIWIRYGVTLARTLALARKNEIIDDWIPKDSPYWDAVQE